MTTLADLPHSPLADIIGRWPVAYLDDIHAFLAALADAGPLPSVVINGGFDIWQDGAGPFGSTGYTADQWRVAIGAGATVAVSRQGFTLGQTDVPGEPTYFARIARTVLGAAVSDFETRIESVRTLAGQDYSVSLWLKADSAQTVDLVVSQNFGTGGGPSPAVTSTVASFAVGTAWARFTFSGTLPSIAGKTLGTAGDDYLSLALSLPLAAGLVVLDVSSVDMRAGLTPGVFQAVPRALLVEQCGRFYRRFVTGETPDRQLAPYLELYTSSSGGGAVAVLGFANFPPMRITPTPTRIGSWTLSNAAGQPTLSCASPGNVRGLVNSSGAGSVQVTPGAGTGYTLNARL